MTVLAVAISVQSVCTSTCAAPLHCAVCLVDHVNFLWSADSNKLEVCI